MDTLQYALWYVFVAFVLWRAYVIWNRGGKGFATAMLVLAAFVLYEANRNYFSVDDAGGREGEAVQVDEGRENGEEVDHSEQFMSAPEERGLPRMSPNDPNAPTPRLNDPNAPDINPNAPGLPRAKPNADTR
ncbi:hypothetical protein [Poriferisphaera corsica]|nr:hypothetical protein [Poriferisphaera corsica]